MLSLNHKKSCPKRSTEVNKTMNDTFELNLGCVVYSEALNGIEAQYIFKRDDIIQRGTGIGKRLSKLNKNRRFEGEFEVVYADENGDMSPTLHLTILFDSECYSLTWKIGSEITDIGIGIKNDNKLFVSYQKTT